MNKYSCISLVSIGLASLFLACSPVSGGERRFTYVYETTTAPKGAFEFENWVTWKKWKTGADSPDYAFEFRHELEYGLTDRLQLGLYLPDWSLQQSAGSHWDAELQDVGLEGIYSVTNPATHWLGSALYGEVRIRDEALALEGKLLLQKNWGPWVFAYNAVVEAEFEGDGLAERTGVFEQTAGLSYQITPKFTAGAELKYEIEFPDWSSENRGPHIFYAGPNASFRSGRFFVTATALALIGNAEGEPNLETRMIFGVQF